MSHPPVQAVLGPLIEAGLVATCGVIEFELGWATGSPAGYDRAYVAAETTCPPQVDALYTSLLRHLGVPAPG